MKATKQKVYEAPKAEVIEIVSQGVLCASSGMSTSVGDGGINGMSNGGNYGW